MNTNFFVFSWQFLCVTNFLFSTASTDKTVLELNISPRGYDKIVSFLEPTDQKLANEHLPVWTVGKDDLDKLHLEELVMHKIGAFTAYQDQQTSTAAVFFHQRLQFDGIFDSRYVIQGLHWNPKTNLHVESHTISVRRRAPSRFYTDTLPTNNSIISVQLSKTSSYKKLKSEEAKEQLGSRQNVRRTVYVETLIFVNYDVVELLEKNAHEYVSTVSYLLTLFNDVDMLFSKVKDPSIKLNIAGIIIGKNLESFPFFVGGECHEKILNKKKKLEDHMDVRCMGMFIKNFCYKHAKAIPPGTYDIAVVLTRYSLHYYQYNPKTGNTKLHRMAGGAETPIDRYYDLMKKGTMPVLVATVSDTKEYECFPVLAHELAHLFTVKHDESINERNHLMQSSGKYSWKSLSWSRGSTEHLKKFFESSDSCPFRNEPGSLHPHGPRKIMNVDEQCQCYGFKSGNINMIDRIRRRIGLGCDEHIQCKDKNSEIFDGPIVMDGTPCDRDKVCWATKCVSTKTVSVNKVIQLCINFVAKYKKT